MREERMVSRLAGDDIMNLDQNSGSFGDGKMKTAQTYLREKQKVIKDRYFMGVKQSISRLLMPIVPPSKFNAQFSPLLEEKATSDKKQFWRNYDEFTFGLAPFEVSFRASNLHVRAGDWIDDLHSDEKPCLTIKLWSQDHPRIFG